MKKQTSVFENSLIWFGAGVSIAEILTGTYFAPLGFEKGILAVIIGHIIGCAMLFCAGLIGGKCRKSSMETVKMSFGNKGGLLFSVLNVIQLVGWTAIMIYDGSLSVNSILNMGDTGRWIACIVIGALIVLWILVGISNLGKLNTIAMAALFILTIVMCFFIFGNGNGMGAAGDDSMSFGAAVELSVAMPLSWLPLISDYTREAEKPFKATLASTLVYGAVSCWMYIIGMSASILTGESDIAKIMLKSGLSIAGLVIVILSTVTTTFLDAYSAGISSESIFSKLKGKYVAVAVTIVGVIAAIVYPMDDITDFLYLIGSVFAPMIAILLAAICSSLAKKGIYKDLFFQIAAFLLFLVMAIRDESVGTDLPKYLDIVNTIGYSNFSDFLSDSLSFPGYEFGWIIINYIVVIFGSERMLLVTSSAFYIYSFYRLFSHYSTLPFLSLAIFILSCYYFSGMNLLRQYTAIAILLFSLQYVIDRSFGKFIIIVLLATTVHQTAICFSLIYFVYPIKISKKYLLMTVIGSVAIYIFFGNFLFSRALALLNLSKFEKYIINGENGGLTFFFFILTFVLAGSLLTVQERNNPKIKLFYHMMILALVIQSFSLTVAEFARVTQYFFLSFSVYLPCVISTKKQPVTRLFFICCSAILMIIYFILISQNDMNGVIPYKFMQI